jgi:hypothetical protein
VVWIVGLNLINDADAAKSSLNSNDIAPTVATARGRGDFFKPGFLIRPGDDLLPFPRRNLKRRVWVRLQSLMISNLGKVTASISRPCLVLLLGTITACITKLDVAVTACTSATVTCADAVTVVAMVMCAVNLNCFSPSTRSAGKPV